jgi:glucans biosynthesis protein
VILLDAGVRGVAASAPFGVHDVVNQARSLAGQPYKAPATVPEFLTRMAYDQYRDIYFDRAHALWRDGGGNFQVEFLHPGSVYNHAVTINTYDRSGVQRVPFSRGLFVYGPNASGEKVPEDLGFAGFRITHPLHRRSEFNHVLVFAGASYFRAVARKQVFGLSARGLAIDTALPSGEEFPSFREFWLERPTRDAATLKVLALMDSPRVTGAYEFVLRPGARTLVDVRATIFERKRATELGMAPLTSMFYYGEERARPAGNWRPEVHDSDGLLMESGTGEWIWRPLVNPDRLLVNYFELDNPRGFGLLQRDRSFQAYEDLEARYDLRPNAWVTPIGSWGKGQVKLVQIPTPNEYNDNIVAYWIPGTLPQVGQPIEIAYRIHFQNEDPLPVSSGRVTATRVGSGDGAGVRRVVVDFEGGKLKQLPTTAPVKPVITVGQEGQVVQQGAFKNPVTGGWRLAFQVKPPKGKSLELRAFLKHEGDTLTETWSYVLLP